MAFKEGHKKVGGRKAKTPNKVTAEVKQFISEYVQLESEEFKKRMNELGNRDYCEMYIRLLTFVLPKISPEKIQISQDGNTVQLQIIRLGDGTEIPM